MMMEPLEPRLCFSSINASSVLLCYANGTPGARINRHLSLFVLVHGDSMNAAMMSDMATAVQDQLPADQYQVLILDWSKLTTSTHHRSDNALAVGSALAGMIEKSHIPVSRVNLIGYSAGGSVIGRTASDLKTKTSKVNRIIGIDPAAGKDGTADYAKDSSYSIAFCGDDSYGGTQGSLSAADTILMTGLSTNQLYRHAEVYTGITDIWQNDAGESSSGDMRISSLFSIPSIMNGQPLRWMKNSFDAGFEAVMSCNENGGNPYPLSLTYVNSHRHKVTVD
jgi:pimeloyl-ACP methyl ester carboxylesterase